MFNVKEPNTSFLKQFLTPSIFTARGYHIDTISAEVKLDQNESPWDWPDEIKDQILKKLKASSWNRYPSPFADDLTEKIASQIGVSPKNILLGPGSNYLIGLLLQTFCKKIQGKVVLARPSFALYESHCQYEGIPYEPWILNEDLEYDLKTLPELPKGSLVLFASPNNPVGNVLERSTLEHLLKNNPDVLFVADEAYCEFASQPYTDFLSRFDNLIIIRTFSKTLGAAGIRLGYILAGANVIELLRKPRVPFLLNQFTTIAANAVFEEPKLAEIFANLIKNAITERTRVCKELLPISAQHGFKIKESQANFVLLRWPETQHSNRVYQHLIVHKILVRNVAMAPGLAGCLRISIGTADENTRLINAFKLL